MIWFVILLVLIPVVIIFILPLTVKETIFKCLGLVFKILGVLVGVGLCILMLVAVTVLIIGGIVSLI